MRPVGGTRRGVSVNELSTLSRHRLRRGLVPLAVAALAACQESTGPSTPERDERLAPPGALRNLTGATTTDIIPVAAPGNTQWRGDARGLNASGQVTGALDRIVGADYEPYRWSPGGALEIISVTGTTRFGADINDAGVVAGQGGISVVARRAFRAIGTTGTLLPTLPSTISQLDAEASAFGINNAGQIVGWSHTGTPSAMVRHATLWSAADVPQDLGTLGGTNSEALDINAAGQVIGKSQIAGDAATHFFLWSAGAGMVDLNTVVSPAITNVVEINDAGQIIGDYTTAGGATHAFLYTPGSGLLDLGTLGGSTSRATGLNNNGQVVGSSTTSGGATHAFLWTPTDGMEDITAITGVAEVRRLNNNLQTLTGTVPPGTPATLSTPLPKLVQLNFTPTVADAPPVAAFTWSCDGNRCAFDASGSTDDDAIVSYLWDFDKDHGGGKTHGVTTKTNYPKGGTHDVMLTVTDTKGQTASVTHTVTIP
jgi:probable HAF family extracellular repeat protein